MLEGRAVFQRDEGRLEKCAEKNCEEFSKENSQALPYKRKRPCCSPQREGIGWEEALQKLPWWARASSVP